MIWIRVFEAWLVARLLRSPAFHRAVANIHGRLTGTKRIDYSEMGGTKIDGGAEESGFKKFVKIYAEEFKETFRRR
ncbi:hypothetical protein DFP73DRAFT_553888 [Morchella snyderi]|nr:hypothetical protein DFP73DRAFT_553888 [Morchella snyderi]